MQDKKIAKEYVLVPVPAELLVTAGIFAGDAVQMYVEGNRLILESSENAGGTSSNGGYENCPAGEMGCDKESGVT